MSGSNEHGAAALDSMFDATANRPADASAQAPAQEARRLDALLRLAVLDTPPEPVFDAITAAAAQMCDAPIALVSLIDAERQWFKSNVGLPGVTQTPRALAFCDHAIRGSELFVVDDARLDARFAENPLVTGTPDIRFYAGAPITTPSGDRIGTVCVIDRQPRHLSDAQRTMLASLGRIASAALEVAGRQAALSRELAAKEALYRTIVEDQTELISLATPARTLTFVNGAYARHFGLAPEQMVGRDLLEFVDAEDQPAVRAHWQAVCGNTEPVADVNRMLGAAGARQWVAWTNRPLRDAAGHVVAVQSVGRDITAERAAQHALACSEARFRTLYEATPAILHSVDLDGRLLDVSNLWLEVMGYQRDEVIGRRSSDFLAPKSRAHAIQTVLPEFFSSGRCDAIEYQFVRKNGSLIDVLLSGVLERDAAGLPLRSLAVLQDVTAAKRMAEELTGTHARLDAIVDNVPALLGYWDAERLTRFANREFQAAIGLPTENIIGRPLQEVLEAVDPPALEVLATHVDAVLSGRRQEFEFALLTTAGLRQLRTTLIPDQREPGRVGGFYGIAHDITGRKALELRLSESELRYRSLFDNLNSGFALHEIVLDGAGQPVDYKFLAMNAAFSAMTGLQPASSIGRRVTELLPGIATDPADWIGVYGRVALTGEPRHFDRLATGTKQWFEIVAYRPAAGQFAVIATEITQRKAAEAALQRAYREKEALLSEVDHRVKNNLQVVQRLLNLQRSSLPDTAARTALDDSLQRVRAMALVHQKAHRSGNFAAVALPGYMRVLLAQIGEADSAAPRRIMLQAEVPEIEVGLDSAIPFGLLVTELVTNAVKHAFADAAEGTVVVALREHGDGLLLSVSDDGVGLPAGFTLTTARSMGLQLAIGLARELGGELALGATERGAAFDVRLPRLELAAPSG